jgi:hypothetical protein
MCKIASLLLGGIVMFVLITSPTDLCAEKIPDTVKLDTLKHLYDKVDFNHAEHVTITGNCSVCHHHTTGTPEEDPRCARCHKNSGSTRIVACKGCHAARPFSATAMRKMSKTAYHIDKLGLTGAYHQACAGCHRKMGGPTGCTDCHEREKEGDAFYKTGAYKPAKTVPLDKSP